MIWSKPIIGYRNKIAKCREVQCRLWRLRYWWWKLYLYS